MHGKKVTQCTHDRCSGGVYRCNRRLHPSPRAARLRSSCPLATAGPCMLEHTHTHHRDDHRMTSQHWHWLWSESRSQQSISTRASGSRMCIHTPQMMDHVEASDLREEAADGLAVVLPVADRSRPEEQPHHQTTCFTTTHLFIKACAHQERNESLTKGLSNHEWNDQKLADASIKSDLSCRFDLFSCECIEPMFLILLVPH